ncbi:MAG: MFS transporter, partial [Clostridiales bacterium]|nr:MFS transporter [Clostridiales bacterium]
MRTPCSCGSGNSGGNLTLKLAILSISLLSMGTTIIAPALADIGKAFPDQSQDSIKLLVTMPPVLVIIFTIISGKLSEYISNRLLILLGGVLFVAGGVLPFFSESFAFLMAMRIVLGIGIGFFNPFTSGLITDFFEGTEKETMLGFQGAIINIGSIVTSFIAGIVCTIDWHYSFLVYGIGMITVVMVGLLLPEPVRHVKSKHEKISVDKRVYLYALGILLYVALMFCIYTSLSFFMEENKLGNAATSGTAITFMTLGALGISFVFGRLLRLLKGYCIPISVLLTAFGLLIISMSDSPVTVSTGCVLVGVGFGLMNPAVVCRISEISHKAVTKFSISLVFSAFNIGAFISPFIIAIIGSVSGNLTSRYYFLL